MSQVAGHGYNPERNPAGERISAHGYANYPQEHHVEIKVDIDGSRPLQRQYLLR